MAPRNMFVGALNTLREIGWTPGSIIDIGVANGTFGLYTIWPGVPICLVEPAPASFRFLDEIAAKIPNVKSYRVGASNRSGTMKVRQHETGLFVTFGDHKPKWREIEVPVMTCDEIMADSGMTGPYLYKLDTDAHEIEILEGSIQTLKNTDVVVVEMNFLYPVIGLAGPNDIWRMLADNGFTILDVTNQNYSLRGVARGADVFFVRQDSELFNKLAWKAAAKQARPIRQDVII